MSAQRCIHRGGVAPSADPTGRCGCCMASLPAFDVAAAEWAAHDHVAMPDKVAWAALGNLPMADHHLAATRMHRRFPMHKPTSAFAATGSGDIVCAQYTPEGYVRELAWFRTRPAAGRRTPKREMVTV